MTHHRSHKTPTHPRALDRRLAALGQLVSLAGVALLGSAQAHAQAPEPGRRVEEVVQRALALAAPDHERRALTRAQTQRAQLEARLTWPWPTLTWSHEQVWGDLNVGVLEVTGQVHQELDLSSSRAKLRAAQQHHEAALALDDQAQRDELTAQVIEAFYRALYHQRRAQILTAWVGQLEVALARLLARAARQDVAPLEVRRMERAVALVRARAGAEDAQLAQAWATLQQRTGWAAQRLAGDLAPAAPESPRAQERPAPLERLDRLASAWSQELEALDGEPWRGWQLGLGYRYAQVGPSVGHGVVMSLSAPLPLWTSAEQHQRDALMAQLASLRHERARRLGLTRRAQEASHARQRSALAALEAMGPERADDALTSQMMVALEAGEATLLELLDAIQIERELALTRQDLAWLARQAWLDHERLRLVGAP